MAHSTSHETKMLLAMMAGVLGRGGIGKRTPLAKQASADRVAQIDAANAKRARKNERRARTWTGA